MELEDLRNFAPAAQNEFLDREAHEQRVASLKPVREDLVSRLTGVIEECTALSNEFGCYSGMYVQLELVPEDRDEETGTVLPGGYIGVHIVPVVPDRGGDNFHRSSNPKPGDSLAYELEYYFVEGAISKELTYDPRDGVLMDLETTLGNETNSRGRTAYKTDRMRIEDLPSFHHTPGNVAHLQNYIENYLPERTAQIETLERSLEIIKEALDNPDLNPTVELIRADNELSARTEALMNDEDDQEEAAQRPRRWSFRH